MTGPAREVSVPRVPSPVVVIAPWFTNGALNALMPLLNDRECSLRSPPRATVNPESALAWASVIVRDWSEPSVPVKLNWPVASMWLAPRPM